MPRIRTQTPQKVEMLPENDITLHLKYLRHAAREMSEMGLFWIDTNDDRHGQKVDVYNYKDGATMVSYTYDGGERPLLIIGGSSAAVNDLVSLIEKKDGWGPFRKRKI